MKNHFIIFLVLFNGLHVNRSFCQQHVRDMLLSKTKITYDLVIYGATVAGIAAACNAAALGHTVALIEPTNRIGGMVTNGLSLTDVITLESVTGFYKEYTDRAHQYYISKYGAASSQVNDCFYGLLAEPKVSLEVLENMLAEYPEIKVFRQYRLRSAQMTAPLHGYKVIESVLVEHTSSSAELKIYGRQFIDGSYEGDLAAYSGAPYRIGRESSQEYGERFAGVIYFNAGVILPGTTGEGDRLTQCYNYRVTMTARPDLRVMIKKPKDYNRKRYISIIPVLRNKQVNKIFSLEHDGLVRLQPIVNGKADINDIRGGAPVRFSLLGENYDYPEGDYETRQKISDLHRTHALGLFYFLQNDPDVPKEFQEEALKYGLCRDEFEENENFPLQLYIREARRIIGEHIFTENDGLLQQGTLRAKLHPQSIAVADYVFNCHGVQPPQSIYPNIAEGDFAFPTAPVQIPYGVLVPKGMANLLVPAAMSATHVGFSLLRMEPTFSALGQAAGLASHLAIKKNILVKDVAVTDLQHLLYERKANTIYVADVGGDSPYYEAVQYFGNKGFLHVLPEALIGPRQERKHRFSLHFSYAWPHHDVNTEKLLTGDLLNKWVELVGHPLSEEDYKTMLTLSRGECLNWLYQHRSQ